MRHRNPPLLRRVAVLGSATALAFGAIACETDDGADADDPIDDEIREDDGDLDVEDGEVEEEDGLDDDGLDDENGEVEEEDGLDDDDELDE